MTGAVAALLDGGARLHLQHGPIDLLIGADAVRERDRHAAFGAAMERFETVLEELVAELSLLRAPVRAHCARPTGAVAARMDHAVRNFPKVFITPMAAVAGSVADEVLAAMLAATPLRRAYVNNGGDIAVHLTGRTVFSLAMAGLDRRHLGQITVAAGQGIGGIATSGQGGRSLSRGIAESVTVLANSAAQADAAATLIANAVDLPGHSAIRRCRAADRQTDSDLGDLMVVTQVGRLTISETESALQAGADLAERYLKAGLIHGAALFLQGSVRTLGVAGRAEASEILGLEHA